MSTDRWIDKKEVVRIYKGILLSPKKNAIVSFIATWMDIDMIILSEVSQIEKDNYHMISHIWNQK